MRTPLVSAIMPTFNQVAFVEAAIASAVAQDHPDLEVVVADDGSTDGTIDIILSWATRYPDRVIPIVHGGHVGVTLNCNRALERCRGSLQAFHAGDDIWLPGKITRQVEWFAEHPAMVLCGHDVEVFDSASGHRMYDWSQVQPLRAGDTLTDFVRDGNLFHPLGNMVRAAALPPGGYDPRVPLCSDWKFFVDCLARGGARFGFIPGVHARYRQWPGNVSKREAEMLADLLLTLDLVEAEYPGTSAACRHRRGVLLYHRGRTLMARGDVAGARRALAAAAATHPPFKVHVFRAIAALPPSLLAPLQRAARGVRALGPAPR